MSFLLRFKRLCLFLEKNLDSICSPYRDASTEKIRIFGPHCTCQSECCGEYWPITFVSTAQPLQGFAFKDGIKFRSNRLDDVSQIFERCRKVVVGLSPLLQEGEVSISRRHRRQRQVRRSGHLDLRRCR